jgi:hypothetical protein
MVQEGAQGTEGNPRRGCLAHPLTPSHDAALSGPNTRFH